MHHFGTRYPYTLTMTLLEVGRLVAAQAIRAVSAEVHLRASRGEDAVVHQREVAARRHDHAQAPDPVGVRSGAQADVHELRAVVQNRLTRIPSSVALR